MEQYRLKRFSPGSGIMSVVIFFLSCAAVAIACQAAEKPDKPVMVNTTTSRAVLANHSSLAGSATQRKEANGILVERVSLSAGGIMVDVRYRITDLAKAQKVLTRNGLLQMVEQKTKVILQVPNTPKVGKLRQIPKTDEPTRIYWMFFRNTNGVVRQGSKLTLTMGDASIKDLVVE